MTPMTPTDLSEPLLAPKLAEPPLVFISHDNRDGELAEAFAKLLKSVSAGMLKSFRSSDKKGAEGIEFGDEWYKAIMAKLEIASDVVCLLTERSLDRPWLLYEAGVAKGKLGTPVHGLALGVALSRASTGPFYQFQNSDDSEDSLSKLVLQLCRRVQGLEPELDVVKAQVQTFMATSTAVLGKLGVPRKADKKESVDEAAVAKVLEEMKLLVRELPARLEHNMLRQQTTVEHSGRIRKRRPRRIDFKMIDEMSRSFSRRTGEPIGILLIASSLRDEFPWLYELGMEAYRAIKAKPGRTPEALKIFREAIDYIRHGHFLEMLEPLDAETADWLRELPDFLEYYFDRIFRLREESPVRPKAIKSPAVE
jgi:hypothetical protein